MKTITIYNAMRIAEYQLRSQRIADQRLSSRDDVWRKKYRQSMKFSREILRRFDRQDALAARATVAEITKYAGLLAYRDGNDQCSIVELAQWIETGKGGEWLNE